MDCGFQAVTLDPDKLPHIKKICVNITYKCSGMCVWCDRLLDRLKISDSDMTVEQTKAFAEFVASTPWKLNLVRIAGGEPVEHPQFMDIIEAMKPILSKCKVRVSTRTQQRLLPDGFYWRVDPIKEKSHMPFMISPKDLGVRAEGNYCTNPRGCGICYDKWGWSFCPVGSIMSRALGLGVHSNNPPSPEMDWRVCEHCIYSLPNNLYHLIQVAVMEKKMPFPSQTFDKMVREYKARGETFNKVVELAAVNRGEPVVNRLRYFNREFIQANEKLKVADGPKVGKGLYADLEEEEPKQMVSETRKERIIRLRARRARRDRRLESV